MTSTSSWAQSRLSVLLPIDSESISQILNYTSTLSKPAAAEHLKNLLGDTPQALEFISSYNAHREDVLIPAAFNEVSIVSEESGARTTTSGREEGPDKQRKQQRKKKPGLGKLPPPRQVEGAGNVQGAYRKDQLGEDYMPSSRLAGGSAKPSPTRNTFALSSRPEATSGPIPDTSIAATGTGIIDRSEEPVSVQGSLLQGLNNVRLKAASPARHTPLSSGNASRNISPAPSQKPMKVVIQGGKPMRGASSTLSDLDAAIRALEITTNPTLSSNTSDGKARDKERQCNCVAARHPLLAAAPNCLHCGKVICVKQGLGPCTFCHRPLLSSSDIQAMIRELRTERGHERQEANNQSKRRADVSSTAGHPTSTSTIAATDINSNINDQKLDLAKAHRDKLLAYQSQNAQRTTLHDEAADYDTQPVAGSAAMQWASPIERAKRLKQQQAILREQEWNAEPEYEKRQMVVSLDVDGSGKARATKKMMGVEKPKSVPPTEELLYDQNVNDDDDHDAPAAKEAGEGVFANNPFLTGNLIRPIYPSASRTSTSSDAIDKGKNKMEEGESGVGPSSSEQQQHLPPPSRKKWRRIVQDDDDDNEAYILDGGVFGHGTSGAERADERRLGYEEHAFG